VGRYVWGRGEVHTGLWWGNLKKRDNLEDLSVDGRIILKFIFKKWDCGEAWNKLIWIRMRTRCGLL
jgi:hypothetical protein